MKNFFQPRSLVELRKALAGAPGEVVIAAGCTDLMVKG